MSDFILPSKYASRIHSEKNVYPKLCAPNMRNTAWIHTIEMYLFTLPTVYMPLQVSIVSLTRTSYTVVGKQADKQASYNSYMRQNENAVTDSFPLRHEIRKCFIYNDVVESLTLPLSLSPPLSLCIGIFGDGINWCAEETESKHWIPIESIQSVRIYINFKYIVIIILWRSHKHLN